MSDSAKKMTESVIVELVKSFLLKKVDGNWHEEKVRQAKGHKFETPDRQSQPGEGIANRPSWMAKSERALRRKQVEDCRP